ncbi:MAG: extensin family protein [Hyphomonadaceae bacterium]
MAESDKRDEERARLIAAGALALTALIAFILVIGRPRETASPAEPSRVAATALHPANLQRFAAAEGACLNALRHARIGAAPVPDLNETPRCGYANAVELTQSLHPYSGSVTTTCALAAALVLWERDVVGPAAARHLGQRVARIELSGPAYSCRAIAGRDDGRMSEHASANAIDIGGFTLEDGRLLRVEQGWTGTPAERAFLRAVRDGACGTFRVVLSPDYNRAHRDHLHLDMGAYELCR